MKRLITICCVVGMVLATTNMGYAAPVETTSSNSWMDFGTIEHFEAKNGNQAWSVAEKDGATVGDVIYPWQTHLTPIDFDFEITHDSSTGYVTMTVSGADVSGTESLVWETGNTFGWNELQILAKTSETGNSTNIYDLDLDATPLTNSPLLATNGGKEGLYLTGMTFKDFTLTGSVTFSGFTSDASTEAFIGWDQAIPEPATICLLGLGALSLLRRKRSA